jgi:hypothetical protein
MKKMRNKIIALFAALSLLILCSSCGSSSKSATVSPTAAPSTPEPAEEAVETDGSETDVTVTESTDEDEPETDVDIDEQIRTLLASYTEASSEPFTTSIAAELQDFPEDAYGFIGYETVDINGDGDEEFLLASTIQHDTETKIAIEIYKLTAQGPVLISTNYVADISYCTQVTVSLFYNDVQGGYCLVVDSCMVGAYTGASGGDLTLFGIGEGLGFADIGTWSYAKMGFQFLEGSDDMAEAQNAGIQYIENFGQLDVRTESTEYYELAKTQVAVTDGDVPGNYTLQMTISE